MEALQNDRLRSMPASFLPPSPVNKPGTEILLISFWLDTTQEINRTNASLLRKSIYQFRENWKQFRLLKVASMGLDKCQHF